MNSQKKTTKPHSNSTPENFDTLNPAFIKNIQTAILLSLLEKGYLTRWQFDLCIENLDKTRNEV